jgi:hypothetical protein
MILKELGAVNFVFVSWQLVREGAETFACSDGHDMSCPSKSSLFPG